MSDYEREQMKSHYARCFENIYLEQRLDTSSVGRITVVVDDYAPLGYEPTEFFEEVTD